jgi:hypothetical protein
MTARTGTVGFVLEDRHVRAAAALAAVVLAVLGVLFVLQVPAALAIWPFPGRTALSNTFIGSIFLAAAASMGWCLLTRSDRGFAGIALDILVIFTPLAVISFATALGGGGAGVALFGVVCAIGTLVGLWLLRWAWRHPWRDPRPTPGLVRWAFAAFVAALVVAGLLLIIQVPRILPWTLTPQLSTLFGCMFLGASAYFAYGVIEPRWENAGGQLAGFLAYDLVLLVPLLSQLTSGGRGRLYDTGPGLTSLNGGVYTAVILGSAVLALYYLVVRRDTRPWTRAPATTGTTGTTAD